MEMDERSNDVESLLCTWLKGKERGTGPDFEELCAQRPELEQALREARAIHERGEAMFGRLVGASRTPLAQLSPLQRDRYDVLGELARGGMGVVLEVRDRLLHRTLAMKRAELRPRGVGALDRLRFERSSARLLREAQVLAQLEHPGVVPLYDVGTDTEGRPCLVMLRVRGMELGEVFRLALLAREGWSEARALGVLLRVCEAIAYAHSKGVVHRDLKPSNVMVGRFGETYVMDWGLARIRGLADEEGEARPATDPMGGAMVWVDRSPMPMGSTLAGDVVGTPAYMSPEQARGEVSATDERSDVYALGAMLRHLLAGKPPYADDHPSGTPIEILRAVRVKAPRPLHSVAPDANQELVAICEKAMERDPARRFASVHELAADLRAFLEGRVVRSHSTGWWIELKKWMRRHRMVVALGSVLLAVVFGATIGFALLYRHAEAQRVLAEERLAFLEQNPSGHRVDLSGIPTLPSLHLDFDSTWLEPPMRIYSRPQDIEQREGALVLHRHGPTSAAIIFGLDPSFAVIRGDFELRVDFRTEGLSMPERGLRHVGLNVLRARDGSRVARVRFQHGTIQRGDDPRRFHGYTATLDGVNLVDLDHADMEGRMRISREGDVVSVMAWNGSDWLMLHEERATDEALQFFVYTAAEEGDPGEFLVAIESLRFESHLGDDVMLADSILVHFDEALPVWLVPWGNAGVAGVVDGRLLVTNFDDVIGYSGVQLFGPQYALRGDFDVRFRLEILEPAEEGEAVRFIAAVSPDVVDAASLASLETEARRPAIVEGRTSSGDSAGSEVVATGGMRMRRVGENLILSHWVDGWRELLTTHAPEGDLRFSMGLDNAGRAAGATIAIDELLIEGLVHRQSTGRDR